MTAPYLLSSNPANNDASIPVDSDLILNFSEPVLVQSGNIVIKRSSDNSVHETIDITSSQVTGSGSSTLTVAITNNFESITEYYVQIANTAIDDLIGNSYVGISDTTSLSFTTAVIDPVISDLQKINPSAIIELFELQLSQKLHGTNTKYRFHNNVNLKDNQSLIFAGNTYMRMPIKAEGFAFTRGQIPRPTITISNIQGTITALLLSLNQDTAGNDLTGATVTRITTLARFLDSVNFAPETLVQITNEVVANPADAETITFVVTVQNVGGSNYFYINGVQSPIITMKRGSTYIFDVSHSSNSGHPFRIKSDSVGEEPVDLAQAIDGNDIPEGTTGATVTYQPPYPDAPSDLRYYCTIHGNGMGNTITMNNPSTITTTVQNQVSQTVNPYGVPDPTATGPREVYKIDRKATETRDIVTFELAAPFDLGGIRVPGRQCTRSQFPAIGSFIQ